MSTAPAVARVAPPLGVIGPYRLLRPLGSGGTADVYETVCPTTGEPRALKLQRNPTCDRVHARFVREYQVLASCTHPGFPRVHDLGVAPSGAHYLVMERLDGLMAKRYVRSFGPPGAAWRTRRVIGVLAGMADALACLHERGLAHGDVKPGNAVVAPGGVVRLLDLGGARAPKGAATWFAESRFFGTTAYAAPEQLCGQAVGPPADVYSLGVTAWRLFAGTNPFEGHDRFDTARRHRTVAPPPLAEACTSVPPPVAALVGAQLAKSPDARPSAAEARAVLLSALSPPEPPLPPLPPFGTRRAEAGRKLLRGLVLDVVPGQVVVVTGAAAQAAAALAQVEADARALGYDVRRRDKTAADAIATAGERPLVVVAPAIDRLARPARERLWAALRAAAAEGRPTIVIGARAGDAPKPLAARGLPVVPIRLDTRA